MKIIFLFLISYIFTQSIETDINPDLLFDHLQDIKDIIATQELDQIFCFSFGSENLIELDNELNCIEIDKERFFGSKMLAKSTHIHIATGMYPMVVTGATYSCSETEKYLIIRYQEKDELKKWTWVLQGMENVFEQSGCL